MTLARLTPTTRFERVRRIGEGATGVVYEARDRERGTRVALKTLRDVTVDSFASLAREFRTVQGVRHPNLVSLGELYSEGHETFFTMDLVEGTDFLDHVRPPDTGLDEARLRGDLKQLAEGLSALHDAGFVHRDVKPSNVRVTHEGRVVLLDFSLAVEAGGDDWRQEAAGTPAYMAPEQVVSAHVGAEADWYAVGVMLFEALTGKVPFDGSPLQIVTRKQREESPAPSSLAGGIPKDLDRLCAALLSFDPEARPTGTTVLRILRGDASSLREDGSPSLSSEGPFVGRATELETLASAFRDSRGGPPITLVVEGGSGLGKSALVRRFVERLPIEVPEVVALSARCYEHDVLPYGAVRGIVETLVGLLTRLPLSAARALVPTEPLALVQLFPAFRRVEAIAELARGPLPPFAPLGLRARAFGLMRDLLRRLGERGPIVMVIYGAQWADDDSLALLAEVTRGAADAPKLLLVLTVDTAGPNRLRSQPTSGAWCGRTLADLHGTMRRVILPSLASEDASALAVALMASAGETDATEAEACARRAHGDPLLLDRLIRHWDRLPGRGDAELTFEEVLGGATLSLDETARAILETVCVAGVPIAQDALGRAAEVDKAALVRNVSRLVVSGMAKTTGPRGAQFVAPYHDRLRVAVLARIDPTRRIDIHRRIAEALETSDRIDPGPLATHWLGAGDRAQAGHYAVLAADAAIEQLAFDCAARFYERALSSAPAPSTKRVALLVQLGKARANAGWGKHAADAFLEAAEGADGTQALQLRRRAAEELLMAGDIEGGTAVLRDVLARLGMWMPSSSLSAVLSLLFFRAVLFLRGMRYELRDQASVPAQTLVRLNVCWIVARVLGNTDRPVGAYFATRMLLLALRYAEPNALSSAVALEAGIVSAKGVRARARVEKLIAEAETIASGSAAPFARVAGPRMRGLTAYLQGRFTEALELNDRATVRTLEMAPDEYFAMRQTQLYSLWTLAALGEVKELSARLTRALREATDRRDVDTITALRWGLFAPAWLRGGDSKGLRNSIAEAMRPWAKSGYNGHHHFACSALAQVDLYEGLGNDAFERVAEDFPRARRAFRLNVEIRHCGSRQLRGRAAVLAAAQTSPTMGSARRRLLSSAELDARWLRRAHPAYAASWGALLEAGIAGVKGEHTRAMTALEEAIRGLDAVSDRLTAAAARMRLGALRGAEGQALVDLGVAFMREQDVADPARMAAALVPGVDPR